jgi:hypothetical protein
VSLSSLVTVPVKPLNGAANESVQSVCVTTTLCPMKDASQCAVMFHVPATLGHEALPPSGDGEPEDDELELHAQSHSANGTGKKLRIIGSGYPHLGPGGETASTPVRAATVSVGRSVERRPASSTLQAGRNSPARAPSSRLRRVVSSGGGYSLGPWPLGAPQMVSTTISVPSIV